MRGSNSLFNEIFDTPATEKQRRGRSETLDTKRNQALIYRYYFVGHNTALRYEFVLKIISLEFYISEVTVHNVIQQNKTLLLQARRERLEAAELKKRWPHLSWAIPSLKDYGLTCVAN